MKKLILLMFFSVFFINIVDAETIIYDNIITSNYNYIIIDDDINIKYINEFQYDVLINNSYYGTFYKGEKIFYPDNTSVITLYPQNSINTNVSSAYEIAKPSLIIVFSILIGSGLFIFVGFWLYKQWKR